MNVFPLTQLRNSCLILIALCRIATAQEPASESNETVTAKSKVIWLDLKPSEDTGSRSISGEIQISSDNKLVLFNESYLWNRSTGTFTEFTGYSSENVQKEKNRLFANAPHPKRAELISETSINDIWCITKTSLFYPNSIKNFRGTPVRSIEGINWQAGRGGQYLLFGNYSYDGYRVQTLEIFDTESLQRIDSVPGPQDPERLRYSAISQTAPNSVAFVYDRGLEYNYKGSDNIRQNSQFRFPAEWEGRVRNVWFVNRGTWLMVEVSGPNNTNLEFIDLLGNRHLDNLTIRSGCDCVHVNNSGEQIITLSDDTSRFYRIENGTLMELLDENHREDLYLAFSKSEYRAVSNDGTWLAFTVDEDDTERAGLLDLKTILSTAKSVVVE